jgi:uncharacterized protein
MLILGYAASVLMGIVLGLIGGGGSILTVPILVYLFTLDPLMATAYSLFIVGMTALVGGIQALRRGDVDFKSGFVFALPSFVGVYLARAYLLPAIPDQVLEVGGATLTKPLLVMIIFALLMLFSSVSMIKKKKAAQGKAQLSPRLKAALISTEGLVVGVITGIVGAGGGFLIIPALVILVGLPMKTAVGTSLFIITAKSLIGFTGDLQQGLALDWTLLLGTTSLAIMGIIAGGALSSKVPEATLKRGFGFFVLIMGSVIFLDQLRQL